MNKKKDFAKYFPALKLSKVDLRATSRKNTVFSQNKALRKKASGTRCQVVLYHQISAKNSNFSKKLFLCVYTQNLMQIPVKQLVFPDLFAFSSYNCFSDRRSLKIYVTTPIATGFTWLFGPHLALNLPDLRNFNLIANPSSIKPFLSVRTTWKTNQQRYLTSNENISSAQCLIKLYTDFQHIQYLLLVTYL